MLSTIGKRIKQLRLERGLSVDDIAEKLGKNRATVYRYESDEIENFPITVLEPLAKILNTTPAYIMGWDSSGLVKTYLEILEKSGIEYECVEGDGSKGSTFAISTNIGIIKLTYRELLELSERSKEFIFSEFMEFIYRQRKNSMYSNINKKEETKEEKPIYTATAAFGGNGVEFDTLTPEEVRKANEVHARLVKEIKGKK